MLPREPLLRYTLKHLNNVVIRRELTKTSQQPRPEKKHYRLWAVPGDLVHEKAILVRQYTMKWHPGLNAGINDSRTIYALCDGVMVITEEPYIPDWDNSLVRQIYMTDNGAKRAPTFARYVNVIPKRRIGEFKLIDEV